MIDLRGKTVLITGAAQGIGFALAKSCAARNMRIVMTDIDAALLEKSARKISELGASVIAVTADVTKPEDWETVKSKVYDISDGIDVLINNAGLLGTPARTWDVEPSEWDRVLQLNLYGMLHGIRTFVPDMIKRGSRTHIVNLSSVAGHTVQPFTAPYHVSKFGVTAVSESLVHEFDVLDVDIGLTLVCPGFTRTNILGQDNLHMPAKNDGHMNYLHSAFINGVSSGVFADEVASATLQAVEDNRFYVFTSPGTLDYATERFEKISKCENPILNAIMRQRYLATE